MKKSLFLALILLMLTGCDRPKSTNTAPTTAPSTPVATSASTPNFTVGTFTFGEIDLAGCGLSLYAPGTDFRQVGIYLFSGLVNPDAPSEKGSMRMKIDGQIVNFRRTQSGGDAIPGGQFSFQTFESEDGSTTVTVKTGTVTAAGDPEANTVSGATITVNRDGQEITLEAVGDTGC